MAAAGRGQDYRIETRACPAGKPPQLDCSSPKLSWEKRSKSEERALGGGHVHLQVGSGRPSPIPLRSIISTIQSFLGIGYVYSVHAHPDLDPAMEARYLQ